ncbi:MAG: YdcF family protein [Acidisphaera sp.]|nr:YdcF family protein [Acidisphaera sp.]
MNAPAAAPHRARRLLLLGLGVLGGAAAAWAAGFLWFVQVAEIAAPPPPQADGIVVLTGGADRVRTGLELLREGRAGRLLISGAARGSDLAEMAGLAGLDPRPLESRVTVGHAAASTRGNAQETAEWAHSHDLHSLIVVTASYHMPRAMAELGRVLPDTALYPAPVVPPALRAGDSRAVLRLLASEYTKWLATELGLSRFIPERAERTPDARHRG